MQENYKQCEDVAVCKGCSSVTCPVCASSISIKGLSKEVCNILSANWALDSWFWIT